MAIFSSYVSHYQRVRFPENDLITLSCRWHLQHLNKPQFGCRYGRGKPLPVFLRHRMLRTCLRLVAYT